MRRGFFILEAIVGMVLLAVIAGSFIVLMSGRNQVATRVRDRQWALQNAEAALIEMQNHERVTAPGVHIEPVGLSQGKLQWVRVTADAGDQKAQLYGLIPAEAKP